MGCHFLLQGIFLTRDWASISYSSGSSCIGRWLLYHYHFFTLSHQQSNNTCHLVSDYSHSLWWDLRKGRSGCENTGYWPQIAEMHLKAIISESKPRLLRLPIHRKVLNSLTWEFWFSLINNNLLMFRLLAKLLYNLAPPLASSEDFSQGHLWCCLPAWSPKNSHQIKQNSSLLGCDYFVKSTGFMCLTISETLGWESGNSPLSTEWRGGDQNNVATWQACSEYSTTSLFFPFLPGPVKSVQQKSEDPPWKDWVCTVQGVRRSAV